MHDTHDTLLALSSRLIADPQRFAVWSVPSLAQARAPTSIHAEQQARGLSADFTALTTSRAMSVVSGGLQRAVTPLASGARGTISWGRATTAASWRRRARYFTHSAPAEIDPASVVLGIGESSIDTAETLCNLPPFFFCVHAQK